MSRKKADLFRSLAHASSRAVRHVERALKPHGLASVTQFIYLRALTEAPGGYLFVGELQIMATFDAPDVARVVTALVRAGYAKREHDEQDRRRVKVWATKAGAQVIADATPDYYDAIGEALAAFSDEDCKVARHYLEAINETVEGLYVQGLCA